MSKFSPTSKANPCPSCGDTKGNCRHQDLDEIILCMSANSSRKGEIVEGGYKIIDFTEDGLWAVLKLDNQEWAEEQKQRWADEQRRRREHSERQEKQKLAQLLPISDRDRQNRHISRTQGLNQKHRYSHLSEIRGLNFPEIDFAVSQEWICSWEPGKEIDGVSPQLAGINPSGIKRTLLGVSGIAIAANDSNGKITGFQIANDNREFAKYIWSSSASKNGNGPHVPSGELPVFYWRHPEANKITETWLIEGGLKSLITALKLWFRSGRKDIQVIGASGANWHGSINLVLEGLQSSKIILFPDAGSLSNDHILRQYKSTIKALTSKAYSVSVAWWGQNNKNCNDIDELPIEEHQFIEYISYERFIALSQKYGGIKPEQQEFISNYDDKVAAVQKKLHTLSYAADIECDPHQKYLPDLLNRIPSSGNVFIVAAKGSGKSHQINLIKQKWCGGYWEERIIEEPYQLDLSGNPRPKKIERIWHEKTGKKFISINARIALGREQAIKWEFTWLEDADLDKPQEFQHDGEIIQTATVLETIGEIGLCWDSLSKLFDRNWSDTLVIIDEIELGLAHVSSSSTCRDRRSKILHTLEVKLKECLDNGGLVIGADADLTDISYEYLTSIAPNHIPFIVRHDYIRPDEDKWDIEFHTGKRDEILSRIFDHLADKNCEPIALATDNQAEAEAIANALIKKYPYLKKEIGGLIRIDSKITQTDFGKNFVKRPNESTEKYQPKILIYTPSLGVGCSIDLKYYNCVYGLFFGNLEPSQARQMLARIRQPIPRIVWCKDRASNAENDHTSFLPDVIKKQMFQYNETADNLIETALYLAKEKAKGVDSDVEILPHLIEALQGMMGENGSWNNPHIDLFCKLKARRNYALSQLALQLRQELIDEGHNLTDYTITDKTSVGDLIKEEKEEVKQHRALMVSHAQDITIEEAKQIDRKTQKTEDEEYQSSKAHLKEELPGIELTQEFIYKAVFADHRRWLNQVKLFWMLQNPEATKEADRKHWKYKLKQFFNTVTCLQDVRTFSTKVDAFIQSNLIGIIKLDDFQAEYHENNSSLQDWFTAILKRNRKSNFIKIAFGITITKDTQIIKFINKLLSKIGLKLVKRRKGTDDTIYYKLHEESVLDTDRIAVLQALTFKYEQQQLEQLAREQSALEENQRQAVALTKLNNCQSSVEFAAIEVVTTKATQELYTLHETKIEAQTELVIEESSVTSHQSSVELVAAKLRQASHWEEINFSQWEIDQAWLLLTQDEQSRIWAIHSQFTHNEAIQQAIALKTEIKEVGFGSHFRSYILKAVRGGIAIARKCWGDKQECEIPISQLLLSTG